MTFYRPVRTEETAASPHAAPIAAPRLIATGLRTPKEGARKCTKRLAGLLGITIVLLAVFIVGCSGDTSPTPTAKPEEVNQVLSIIMNQIGLTPGDLSEAEESCLQESVADIDPETYDVSDPPPEVGVNFMACIPDVFIHMIIGEFGLTPEDLSREETACLRAWIVNMDPGALTADDPPLEVGVEMTACIPDVFIQMMVGEFGLTPEDLSREETSCLRAWIVNMDPRALTADNLPLEVGIDMMACIPDVFVQMMLGAFGLTAEDLSSEETSCLRAWIVNLDPRAFKTDDLPLEVGIEMAACIPDVFISLIIAEDGYDLSDLTRDELSCLRRWMANIDPASINAGDLSQLERRSMTSCAPRIFNP